MTLQRELNPLQDYTRGVYHLDLRQIKVNKRCVFILAKENAPAAVVLREEL